MIFFNNEGTENGGLVFDGALVESVSRVAKSASAGTVSPSRLEGLWVCMSAGRRLS